MSRILVLDDNADIIVLFKTILERWGFEVITASNGEEGLAILSSEQPAAIISNLRMPLMDGMTFLDRVRLQPEWNDIPFIMMSGLFPEEFGNDAMARGADAYLTKPFRASELNAVLQNLKLI
jgi:CheY-like chemotaxis protein